MKNLMAKVGCVAALAASAVVVPAATGATTAHAAVCTHNWAYLGVWGGGSGTTHVAATNTCGNMWSVRTQLWTDQVKGQFKSNGVWVDSQAGWKVTTTSSDAKKIVLDLIDGEPLRAWLRDGPSQNVMLWY